MFDFSGHSSARVKDGRLILSMPDAETPVVWVMDLNDATTSVLRLESDRQGFYMIKKHSGKAAETVAVYRNRNPAVRALTRATRALDRAKSYRGGNGGGHSRFINTLIVILFIWFALSRFWSIDQDLMRLAIYPFFKDELMAAAAMQSQAQDTGGQQQQLPTANTNPNALGVPLSADEALEAQEDAAGNLMMMP